MRMNMITGLSCVTLVCALFFACAALRADDPEDSAPKRAAKTQTTSASAADLSDPIICREYIDIFRDKVTALEFFSAALGKKDEMQERLALIRTTLDGGLTDKKNRLDEKAFDNAMNVGMEVTEELLLVAKEKKVLDEAAKALYEQGLAASQSSISKEWAFNMKIAQTWITIISKTANSMNNNRGGGGIAGLIGGVVRISSEVNKINKRKPLFRKLREFSTKNRELHKAFKHYAETQQIDTSKDATDELPDIAEIK